MTITTMAANNLSDRHDGATTDEHLRNRALELLLAEIDFISNPEFRAEGLGQNESVDAILEHLDNSSNAPTDLPAHLQRMCESELLTKEQEAELFREMNFLKYRANALRT